TEVRCQRRTAAGGAPRRVDRVRRGERVGADGVRGAGEGVAAARHRHRRPAVDRDRFSRGPRACTSDRGAGDEPGRMEHGGVSGERVTQARRRRRWYLAVAAGVGLFVGTIWSVGPRVLAAELHALAPVIGFVLVLAGARFWFQAAGWRLAMPAAQRPTWRELFGAVVAGEAAGYFAWGAVSR